MKMFNQITIIALFVAFSCLTEINAQNGNCCGNYNRNGWRHNGQQKGMYLNNTNNSGYDLKTEETIKGTMDDFEVIKGKGNRGGLHITLNTDKSKIDVHVGPTWYLDQINLDINKGDKLEIFGSKVTVGDDTFFIASKITKGNKEFSLRDKYGFPKWSHNRNKTSNN